MVAAQGGHLPVVKALVAAGADVRARWLSSEVRFRAKLVKSIGQTEVHDFLIAVHNLYGAPEKTLLRKVLPRLAAADDELTTVTRKWLLKSLPRRVAAVLEPHLPTPFDWNGEAEYERLRNAVRAEVTRVANSARVDISSVLEEYLAVRAEADADVHRGRQVSRFEVLQRRDVEVADAWL